MKPLWQTVWKFLKKLKIGLLYKPAIALLDVYPKDTHSHWKGHMHPNVYSSNVHKSQNMERYPSSDKWVKNMWYMHTHTHAHIHTHYGILLSHQKE